ncbi:MAG: cbb3-type cytochrome c oxidase subunit II [Desulfobacterales bacterium]
MRMTPAVILVGVLSLLAAIALIMVYWPYAQQDLTPSEIFRARTIEEEAGRAIYIQNGCVYCHSQSVRAFDWDMGSERIAQSGDYIADEPIQLGSQRTGVDLSQAGGEHPDDWHIAHFINPRYTRPSSIMPPFEWLGMERIRTLTRYVQSLGLKAADRRMERQNHWKAESINAYEAGVDANVRWLAEQVPEGWRSIPNPYPTSAAALQRGHRIYQYYCIGCHGPIGDGMGPAQPWIYPPPLNFTALKGREISGGIIYYQLMNGITGTAMPYFKRDLESQKIWEVGDYVAYYFINQSDANHEPRGIDAAWEP